jgi:UDP-3-O-[3-hydroxymyristoyl] glucosamine N-acyltransferase
VESTLIRVKDAYSAFTDLLDFYQKATQKRVGIAPSSFVDDSVQMGTDCYVGTQAVIEQQVVLGNGVQIYPQVFVGENVSIGDDCILYSGCQILAGTQIGKGCIIHSGTVIGSDGFGFAPQEDGSYRKIPQTGNVILEDGVEVGANSTIDRATLGSTILRKGVKLDNQIQIAHNVEVGAHTVIAAQSGIAGSTKIGKHCVIGGQVGIGGHLTIGDYVKMQGQSGVTSNIADQAKIQGTPAFDYTRYAKSYVHFRNLPKLIKKLDKND